MNVRKNLRSLAAALGLGALLTAGVAFAQQPPPPTGAQPAQPGQPAPQPTLQRVDPNNLPPALQERLRQMQQQRGAQAGQPGQPPGRQLPPGFQPTRRPPTPAHGAAAGHGEEEHAAGGGHHMCPGHGPLDRPGHINWWRGLLMINNERAQQPDFINQLLFRYHNPQDECDPKNLPPPFLANVINFGLLALILYRAGRKPLAEALAKRRQTIMGDIEASGKLQAEAEARLAEYEAKFGKLQDTLATVRAEFAAQAEQEKANILREAEERRARMRRDAEFRIEQELKAARQQLVQEAVVGAVAAAEQLIAQRIAAGDQDRMADEYLSSVGAALAPKKPGATGAAAGGLS